MAKISKNIKRLRSEKNITQEMLASSLNVTRQTISSWENDRTQPDIDMLEALSSALDADIEELIYGKKRNVGLEADNKESRKLLTIILSVAGSLLTAAGLIILFVNFWSDISSTIKNLFAFIPLAAGCFFGLFAFFKKKNNAVWCESAGLLWIAGVLSTNALVNSLYSVDFGFQNLLLIDIILVTPVMFLLNGVVPFAITTAMTSVWGVTSIDEITVNVINPVGKKLTVLAVFILIVIAPVIFVIREMKKEKPRKVTVWFALLALLFDLSVLFLVILDDFIIVPLVIISVVSFVLFTEEKIFSKYNLNRALVLAESALILSFLFFSQDGFYYTNTAGIIDFVIALFIILSGGAIGKKTIKKDKYLIGVLICTVSEWLITFLYYCFDFEEEQAFVMYIPVAFLIAAFTVVSGVKKADIFKSNIGLITVFASLITLLVALEAEAVFIGVSSVITGVALLVINKIMINKFKSVKTPISAETSESGVENDA